MRIATIKRKDGGYDRIPAFLVDEFPYYQISEQYRRAKNKKFVYMNLFCTFDIETTTIHPDPEKPPEGFMYHWQMDIGGVVVYGRRWEEWIGLIQKITDWLELDEDKRIVCYIHNAGYEFQFARDFLEKYFGEIKIFASKTREPIYFLCSGWEFRCSYKLTNMNLQKACENEKGVIHPKAAGDLDYRIIRTADTALSETEFGYCISDVVSLYEMIENRIINEGDRLDSIPLTSTGYVRRECRFACRADRHYRDRVFKKQALTPTVYTLLKEEGRGGNTHSNRYMAGIIWKSTKNNEIGSYDEISGYPAMLLLRKFPMSKFSYYGNIESVTEFDDMLSKYACLFRVLLEGVKVRPEITMPYIPRSKCLEFGAGMKQDNGRVLSCDWILLTVNDIDWKIIKAQYTFTSVSISDFHIADYNYLPECLRDKILDYFYRKCDLKNQIETCKDPGELENLSYLYAKMKNRLNGIFGMCFTDPCRATITIDEAGEWTVTAPNIEESLEKYNKSRNSFLVYAWGSWCTSWNRLHLQNLLDITGPETIYCDTDSSKAIITPRIRERIEEENQKIIAECEKLGAYADVNGKRYYLGLYDFEQTYESFITLGAKKYAYTDEKGLHITIAGVNKKIGAKELGDLKNFKPGFIFREAGGRCLYYNKAPIHEITVDGCTMTTASNIGMIDSTYELGVTDEYAELIGMNVYKELT